MQKAWESKNKVYWFISPTYKQAKVMWRRIYNSIPPGVFLERNKGDLYFRLKSGSYIFFVSGEVLDNLRSETLDGVIIDEVRNQHPDLWPLVIRPMLGTTGGWGDFISTPNGFDAFHDRYDFAKSLASGDEWAAFQAPSTCNPLFTQDELESARRELTEGQFEQEILAKFRDIMKGKAYKTFGDHNLTTVCPFWEDVRLDWSPYLPIVLGLDFNLSPMAWNLGQTKGGVWWWFDEVWMEETDTQEATEELIQRLKAIKEKGHRSNPMVHIIGDATGKARQRAAASKSDYDILIGRLREEGISFSNKTPDANPGVKERVTNVNAKCRSADGTVRLFIHPDNCPRAVKDGQRVKWKPGAQYILDQKTDPLLTHSFDGIGYAVHKLTPIKKMRDVGTKLILRRI